MDKRTFMAIAAVVVIAAAAWFAGVRTAGSETAGPQGSNGIVVIERGTNFYVFDSSDGGIYVVDVSGGAGEIRSIKLAGNFRAKRVY
jgi:hypothetical protein